MTPVGPKPLDALQLSEQLPKHLIPQVKLTAAALLNYNLKQVLELQTMLASQGVIMTLSTAEIQFLGEPDGDSNPSEASRS